MVKWTNHAKAQLRQIHDYIAQDSLFYAKHVADTLAEKTSGLDNHPRIGRIVPELNIETVRELLPYSYRIIYEIRSDDRPVHIEVLAVIHKRRDMKAKDIPRIS